MNNRQVALSLAALAFAVASLLRVSTTDAQRRRPAAGAAVAPDAAVVADPDRPPPPPPPGSVPSEFPICPDCQTGGAIALEGSAHRVTAISLRGGLRTARDKLAPFVSGEGKATLVVFTSRARTTVLREWPLTGFPDAIWLSSNGEAFSADRLTLGGLTPRQKRPAAWGFDPATGAGFVAEIHLFARGSAGRYVAMPIAIRRPDGAMTPAPPAQ